MAPFCAPRYNFEKLGWYVWFLLKFELEFLLRKTTERLNFKIDLGNLHIHPKAFWKRTRYICKQNENRLLFICLDIFVLNGKLPVQNSLVTRIQNCLNFTVLSFIFYFFYPGHPLFQGFISCLATCPIVLIPVPWGTFLSSWPHPITLCDPPLVNL